MLVQNSRQGLRVNVMELNYSPAERLAMVLDILAEGALNFSERLEKIGITTYFPQPISVEISVSTVIRALHGDMQALKSIGMN